MTDAALLDAILSDVGYISLFGNPIGERGRAALIERFGSSVSLPPPRSPG